MYGALENFSKVEIGFVTSSAYMIVSSFAILRSHRKTQIRCADSVINILYSLFFGVSGLLLLPLKFASPPPSMAPSDMWRSSSYLRFHRAFACSHTILLSVESHSAIMCNDSESDGTHAKQRSRDRD